MHGSICCGRHPDPASCCEEGVKLVDCCRGILAASPPARPGRALTARHVGVALFVVNNNPETTKRSRRSFPTAAGWFFARARMLDRGALLSRAQRSTSRAFTPVFAGYGGALQTPISGLPEIGA